MKGSLRVGVSVQSPPETLNSTTMCQSLMTLVVWNAWMILCPVWLNFVGDMGQYLNDWTHTVARLRVYPHCTTVKGKSNVINKYCMPCTTYINV